MIVNVIGAGLAGSEAAYQLARRGTKVRLFEMRPVRMTEAHQTAMFGELVCSNSLRNDSLETAVGVLKEEMRRLGSLVMAAADSSRVPAGAALAVDRYGFANSITNTLASNPLIEILRQEVTAIAPASRDSLTILATGPLTASVLAGDIAKLTGSKYLYFYDAIAPIVSAESVDMTVAFRASRYGKGGDDYINCPMTQSQYDTFVSAVCAAEKMPAHPFEKPIYFEGCMPIEEMARRGPQTLAFGPMRPVGLNDPRTNKRPAAVVQLRQDDREGRLYNIVGFQTKMTYPEQRRVLRMIPGLEQADFVRLGSLHRNTFIDSPRVLRPTLQFQAREDLFIAGQMIGVEGYVESAAAGLLAGLNAARIIAGSDPIVAPVETALGSLLAYVSNPDRRDFQPMNANYGLMPELKGRSRGRDKKVQLGLRALRSIDDWIGLHQIVGPPDPIGVTAGLEGFSAP
jgi:methylenetetrahydrofolate--tRNA-(uracil-5-)-methyltransferase